MLRKITLNVAVFRRVDARKILGVSDTLSFDRVEDIHFWFDDDHCGAMRPVDAVMRSMTYHMHHVDFMENTSMLTGWKTDVFTADYQDAEFRMTNPDLREVRRATVVGMVATPELDEVTVVWQGTMTEEKFTRKEWEERKSAAKKPPSEISTPHSHQYR